MNASRRHGLALAILVGMAVPAVAQADFDDRWYVGPSVGLVKGDNDRRVEGNFDYHYGLNVGRFLTPNFSLDLRLDGYSFDFEDIDAGTSQHSAGFVGRYHFMPDSATRPYLLGALGLQEHRNILDRGKAVYRSLGIGLLHRYNDRLSLRLELEGRYDNDRATFNRSSGFTDYLLTAGFNFALGSVAAPPPPPPPPPPPAPRPAPEPEPEPEVIFDFNAMVLFEFDSSALRQEARPELDRAVDFLNEHNHMILVEVGGHTCDIGSIAYNQGLSERRAQAVADYLTNAGISGDRLVVRGYGEERPRLPNTSIENRQQNRRVELSVLQRNDR